MQVSHFLCEAWVWTYPRPHPPPPSRASRVPHTRDSCSPAHAPPLPRQSAPGHLRVPTSTQECDLKTGVTCFIYFDAIYTYLLKDTIMLRLNVSAGACPAACQWPLRARSRLPTTPLALRLPCHAHPHAAWQPPARMHTTAGIVSL